MRSERKTYAIPGCRVFSRRKARSSGPCRGCTDDTRIVKIFELSLPIGCYAPTIAPTLACLQPHSYPYSASLWTAKAEGEAMDWKHLLAYITGTVDQALLLRNEYLVTENRILRQQITGRVRLSDGERKTLVDSGQKLGKQALAEVASI